MRVRQFTLILFFIPLFNIFLERCQRIAVQGECFGS